MAPRGHRKTSRREISVQCRVLIIYMRFQEKLEFVNIAQRLRMKESTVKSIWQRTNNRAQDKTDLMSLLEVIKPLPRPGRPVSSEERIPPSQQPRDKNA